MSTSLTKKGLKTAADKYIIGARPALEIIKNFTTDFSAEAVKPGTGIVVDVIKAAAETFAKTSANYKHATNSSTPVTVATDIRKKSTYSLDDLDCIEDETAAALAGNAVAAGRAVGIELIKSVMNKLTYSNRLAALTLGGSTLDNFFALRGMVEKGENGAWDGIDPTDCVLLLEPVTYSTLCSVLNAGIVGDGSVVRGAIIGQALGFKAVYSAPHALLESASGVSNGKGFIVPTGAIAVVNRVVKPLKGECAGLIEYGETTDEVSGITMTQRVVVDAGDGEAFWTTEALFGSKLTREVTNGVANGAPGYLQVVGA